MSGKENMPKRPPNDQLGELVLRFINELRDVPAVESEKVDPPPARPRTGNPFEDLAARWEDFKKHLARVHESAVGAEPWVDDHLRQIVMIGTEILKLTDDQYIVNPVRDLVKLAELVRIDNANIIDRLGHATSLPAVLALLVDLVGMNSQSEIRSREMARRLDALVSYFFLMRWEPPYSA